MAEAKILVVDDSPTELQLMVEPLLARGYRVITATNGIEALEAVARELPQLILLDVLMPGKNGFQVCRQLKSDPATRDIKIMFVSSKNQESDRFWGLKQGADEYLAKPFTEEALLSHISALLG
ncbi:MAG: response regulator [Deltaproteobacteria bacterium]|nr:response regulator [Deltaproteobacteria bacterium]